MKITDERLLNMVEEQCGEAWKDGCEVQIMSASLNGSRITDCDNMPEFSVIRDQVFFRLINPAVDRKLLEQMPFVVFHDLAAVFYVLLRKQGNGQIVMPIQKGQQKQWNVSAAELWRCAMENTPRLFPASLRGLVEIILEKVRECGKEKVEILFPGWQSLDSEPFYVLSNDSRMYGASVLLYEDMLQKAAKQLNADLAVIPSSIHEALLVILDEKTNIWKLKEMLHSVNMEEVSEEDRLSENVYLYRREKGYLEMA